MAGILDACGTIPVVSKANAGIPVWKGAELSFDGTPEVLAAHAQRVRQAGASIIGACCGSTPEHIELMAQVLAGEVPVPDAPPPTPGTSSRESDGDRLARGRHRRCPSEAGLSDLSLQRIEGVGFSMPRSAARDAVTMLGMAGLASSGIRPAATHRSPSRTKMAQKRMAPNTSQ